jgi:amino acid transporter
MEFEGEALRQTGLALVGVAVFVAFLIAGNQLGAAGGERIGALVMVVGIVAFVLVMGALGLFFLEED